MADLFSGASAQTSTFTPDLHVIDGKVTTTSLQVAAHFNKRHDNVLRAIANLECSPAYRLRNFEETVETRENPSGGAPIESPAFRLTRDGFVFLVMGFTGKEAAQWKEAYIEAFNRMEAELLAQRAPAAQGPASVLTFTFESQAIRAILRAGSAWFVAADVCAVLGYRNATQTIAILDKDKKDISAGYTLSSSHPMSIISESGLFLLVERSRKPNARRLEKWITAEMLPAIRAGKYEQPQAPALPALAPSMRGRRWLISTDGEGRETVTPVPADAYVLTAQELAAALLAGEFSRPDLLAIANAATQRLYVQSCTEGPKGIAAQVKQLINRDLPQTDLREIVTSACLELWMRAMPEKAVRHESN